MGFFNMGGGQIDMRYNGDKMYCVIACVNTTLFGRAILDEGKQSLTAFDTWNRLNDECSVVEGGDGLFEAAQ
jgi:hypothetical protein